MFGRVCHGGLDAELSALSDALRSTKSNDMSLDRPPFSNYFHSKGFPSEDEFDKLELKYDGWWGQVLVEGNRWEIYSRTGMLKKSGEIAVSLPRTLLHGEFVFGTEWAKSRKDLYGKVVLYDCEHYLGKDVRKLPLSKRRLLIEQFLEFLRGEGEELADKLLLIEQYDVADAGDVWDAHVASGDYEGMTFKSSSGNWGDRMGRMKRTLTIDYVCVGFEESTSDRYEGRGVRSVLGGLYVNGRLKKVCSVGGLNDEQREAAFDDPTQFVGRVFEAEGYKLSKKGALRHPNFKRWRDDKPVEDCVLS